MREKSSRSELLQKLRRLRANTVTADYDGFGDNGQIDSPEFGGVKAPADLGPEVQDLFYEVLEEHYGGWEINEGSYGHFEWNVDTDRITLQHTNRTEHYEETVL